MRIFVGFLGSALLTVPSYKALFVSGSMLTGRFLFGGLSQDS